MIYLDLFLGFLKIGLFGFGGGLAMLPLIYQEAVRLSGMPQEEFSNLVGISQMTPGPIAVNAATYVGYSISGLPGAIISTFGVMFPSFVLVTIASYFVIKFKESDVVNGALTGIRPVTTGMIASAVVFMAAQSFTISNEPESLIPIAICLSSFVLIGKFRVNPLIVVLGAGVLGAIVLS